MRRSQTTDESAVASGGSARTMFRSKGIITWNDSRTSDYYSASSSVQNLASDGSYLDVVGNRESDGSYLDVVGATCTHLQFQVRCQGEDNGSNGYFEISQVTKTEASKRHSTPVPQSSEEYIKEDEITLNFNKNGELCDMYGYLKLLADEPRRSTENPEHHPTSISLICSTKDKHKQLKRSLSTMKIIIFVLSVVLVAAVCLFLLTLFGILNRKDCPECQKPTPPGVFPLKYTLTKDDNVSIKYALPMLPSNYLIIVDFHRTRVQNQDERLLQVDNVNTPNSSAIESKRVYAKLMRSNDLHFITIEIQRTHCHDHGYITVNISGVFIVNIQLNVTDFAPIKTCPQSVEFKWNATELISCSVCVGNATWNVAWYREVNATYIPVTERKPSDISNSQSFTNELEDRIVSTVEFTFGVLLFTLVNRRVFCSDSGIYKVWLRLDNFDHNFTVSSIVNGVAESCPTVWELKLIDRVRRNCSFCIGETKNVLNLTITQTSSETSISRSVELPEGESKEIVVRDVLTIEANLLSGLVNCQFVWLGVQCIDETLYEISTFSNIGRTIRNVSISIDELTVLRPTTIIQEDGRYGGFAEGFNLSLICNVKNIGCKKREISLTLPNRNTTTECTYSSLGTASYECSLKWTEFNISSDLNQTTFSCGYNYTHYNGTTIPFKSNLTIFVLSGSTCNNVAPGCKMTHPLGGRYFIECDRLSPHRPWEGMCLEKTIFVAGSTKCDGTCEYS